MKKTRNKVRKDVRKTSRTKRKPAASQEGFLFVGPVAVVLLLVASISLTYLYLHHQCDVMGRELRVMEMDLQKMRDQALVEQSRWQARLSLESITDAVARHGLNMRWPDESRIVRVRGSRGADLARTRSNPASWSHAYVHD